MEWEVPAFLESQFPKGQRLREIMTFTGGAINAQASSCRDYISTTWPEIGSFLLDALEEFFLNHKEG